MMKNNFKQSIIEMKTLKTLVVIALLSVGFKASAQLNNAWIDYNKTYYKFTVVSDKITRINQAVLATAGIGSANADHFQLWRNGKQVRLFTSATNAPLGATDFIEFFGEMNDGKADAQLYRRPEFQLADKYSLETDTATYFLTVNPTGGNLRYTQMVNASPSTNTPDAFYVRTANLYYKNQLNRGYSSFLGTSVYSSSYDNGEGFTSSEISSSVSNANVLTVGTSSQTIANLNQYTGVTGNNVNLVVKLYHNGPGTRLTELNLNGSTITVNPAILSGSKEQIIIANNLPSSILSGSNSATVNLTNKNLGVYYPNPNPNGPATPPVPNERMVIAQISLQYPSIFNFNNATQFEFDLPASPTGNYLVIDNFNFGTSAPILYELTKGERYIGEITSTPGKVKFLLPVSSGAPRKFILSNSEATNTTSITNITSKTFLNITTAANRGDYLIISNPALYNDGTGANPVEAYKTYRASANGGNYNAKVYDINELKDQFGFGIPNHPGAVRDFVRYADANFTVKPKSLLIIGRGLSYIDKRNNITNPLVNSLDLVPSFGWPASDVLMVSTPGFVEPIVPVGRIAAINGKEVNDYLQKVITYENEQRLQSPVIADKIWHKNIMQISGGATENEVNSFCNYMDNYGDIAVDTFLGGYREKFCKTDNVIVQQTNGTKLEQFLQEGTGFISYFGHSSATTFEFNLGSPELYNNTGKYPIFNISGCNAGDFYNFDANRMSSLTSLSERYIFTPNKGSIAFIASTHFGIPSYLREYDIRYFQNVSSLKYGKTLGETLKENISYLQGSSANLFHEARLHIEQFNLHGDPAIKSANSLKPDYAVEAQYVKVTPSIVNSTDNFFTIKFKYFNIGKATNDSIRIKVTRTLPNNTVFTVFDQRVATPKNRDSLQLNLPINNFTDVGINKINICLDNTNIVDELYETNNCLNTEVFIFDNSLVPVSPYRFAIENNTPIFVASTSNPLIGNSSYVMELDTTQLFNSPYKKVYNKNGAGGIVEFSNLANVTFSANTVYYWRTAIVPITGPTIWNSSSFVYLPSSLPGYNQSHYYQLLENEFENSIKLDTDRKFKFNRVNTAISVSTGNFPPHNFGATNINMGPSLISNFGSFFGSLQFVVLNGITGQVFKNKIVPGGPSGNLTTGLYQSLIGNGRLNQFQFAFATYADRKKIVDFLDAMPNDAIIMCYPLLRTETSTIYSYAPQWAQDAVTNGVNNSLYHKLKSYGCTDIDLFTTTLPFFFKFSKDGSSPTFQKVGTQLEELVTATLPLTISQTSGSVTTKLIGPASTWNYFNWGGKLSEPTGGADSLYFELYGVTPTGTETFLARVDSSQKLYPLNSVSATQYPYMKVKMFNFDTAKATPYQLDFWRIFYTPIPEGAIAPNLSFNLNDTVTSGQPIDFNVAFKNISGTNFAQNMKIGLKIKNAANQDVTLNVPDGKILVSGDTLIARYRIPSENFIGANTLFAEFNPNNHQPEQYKPNNFLFKNFFVKADVTNPSMDVTFDGVRILNRDLVSSKPEIVIKLTDENKFLALTNSSLTTVQLRYPNGTLKTINYSADTLIFNPANVANGENTATINFRPYLPEDGDYELIVSGKDRSGNEAGRVKYSIVFTVINKAMISEMLNYPNPFTTSTAFVFTLTGSQVPQNIRIQVLTVTGKIVREITKQELGPLRIGRNITDFKWDGTDMYGQPLANGVYLYRVITNQNGNSLEKYKADGDNTNQYFNKGYGKMYLMR
jgi:hypothetical protein